MGARTLFHVEGGKTWKTKIAAVEELANLPVDRQPSAEGTIDTR
jgi:hypothetical protein